MIDGNRIDCVRRPTIRQVKQPSLASVILADVVENNVVNAPAGSRQGCRTALMLSMSGDGGRHNNASSSMDDVGVAHRHVSDLAKRAHVDNGFCLTRLVARSQNYGKALLTETSPDIFHQVGLYQDA